MTVPASLHVEGMLGGAVAPMIGKEYFRRQAMTLRKMVGVATDEAVAARLIHLADDLEAKAGVAAGVAAGATSDQGENQSPPVSSGEKDPSRH